MNKLRAQYNRLSLFLDFKVLKKKRELIMPLSDAAPATSKQALLAVLPYIKQFDPNHFLKGIFAPYGVNKSGEASKWEFLWHAEKRRAIVWTKWQRVWTESCDGYGFSSLLFTAKPFLLESDLWQKIFREGTLIYPQIRTLWAQERQEQADLPLNFSDSSEVVEKLIEAGLDPNEEFSFQATESSWIAHGRDQTFSCPF